MNPKRLIAIHLPQYYPFKENNEWWGEGFTEWRSVTTAKPRFLGHYQPRIPADSGFYDLRLHESRLYQENLARKYGIYGFCYYHYWFHGKLIMENPLEQKLANEKESLPFMLCWANESWHRNWSGGFNETLIEQHYSPNDDIAHFNYLLPYFLDSRYIRINNQPVFCIYRTHLIPHLETMIQTWQSLANKNGFQIYFIRFEDGKHLGSSYMSPGINAAMEFQPLIPKGYLSHGALIATLCRRIFKKEYFNFIYSYRRFVKYQCNRTDTSSYKRYPCVFPSWDNSPRRKKKSFMAFTKSTPTLFEKWVLDTLSKFSPYSADENFIFINAWNEWAEGCYLEPDLKFGRKYLEAIKQALMKSDNESN